MTDIQQIVEEVCLSAHWSPIHTARWSRKISQKIAGVPSVWTQTRPGINSGIDPGWGPSNMPGSVPERALCEQKPDQCRKGCVVVIDALYRSTVLPGLFEGRRSHDEKYVNWNEAAIRELLTIRAEAEIILQFSEMVRGALYTSHEMSRVFSGSLRVVCECTHRFRKITGSVNAANLTIRETNAGTHYPCIFRNLCVKGAWVTQEAQFPLDWDSQWERAEFLQRWHALHEIAIKKTMSIQINSLRQINWVHLKAVAFHLSMLSEQTGALPRLLLTLLIL